MTETEVLVQLINGIDWWNHITHEYVYYNDWLDYEQGTLTISEMVLYTEDGYMGSENDSDRDASRLETCRRIVSENGWMRYDDPRTYDYKDEVRKYRYDW